MGFDQQGGMRARIVFAGKTTLDIARYIRRVQDSLVEVHENKTTVRSPYSRSLLDVHDRLTPFPIDSVECSVGV